MESSKSKIVSYTLKLNESEATWLKGMVQNPILDEGMDPSFEDDLDRDMRAVFWEALK